jgi:glycogen debranching enzyme
MTQMRGQMHSRLEQLATTARGERGRLEVTTRIADRDLTLYRAGRREGSDRFGLFGRDLLVSAMLLRERPFSADVLRFVNATLGSRFDPRTGEEPGRALHEFDDVEMRGLSTRYNASEVSLLFLIAAADHLAEQEDDDLVREISPGLSAAVAYLVRHIEEGLFREDPAVCGARRYALRATYWKDSRLPGRDDPVYPVVYALVQAQAVAALRAAVELADRLPPPVPSPTQLAEGADQAADLLFSDLWDPVLDYPMIALDGAGPIRGISSDALQMLAYIEPKDLPPARRTAILCGAESLVTPCGYRAYAPGQAEYDPHAYHLGSIWPFEQAIIARGAERHGLDALRDVAFRVADVLETLGFPELVYWSAESDLEGATAVDGQGCDLQLWSASVPAALLAIVARM